MKKRFSFVLVLFSLLNLTATSAIAQPAPQPDQETEPEVVLTDSCKILIQQAIEDYHAINGKIEAAREKLDAQSLAALKEARDEIVIKGDIVAQAGVVLTLDKINAMNITDDEKNKLKEATIKDLEAKTSIFASFEKLRKKFAKFTCEPSETLRDLSDDRFFFDSGIVYCSHVPFDAAMIGSGSVYYDKAFISRNMHLEVSANGVIATACGYYNPEHPTANSQYDVSRTETVSCISMNLHTGKVEIPSAGHPKALENYSRISNSSNLAKGSTHPAVPYTKPIKNYLDEKFKTEAPVCAEEIPDAMADYNASHSNPQPVKIVELNEPVEKPIVTEAPKEESKLSMRNPQPLSSPKPSYVYNQKDMANRQTAPKLLVTGGIGGNDQGGAIQLQAKAQLPSKSTVILTFEQGFPSMRLSATGEVVPLELYSYKFAEDGLLQVDFLAARVDGQLSIIDGDKDYRHHVVVSPQLVAEVKKAWPAFSGKIRLRVGPSTGLAHDGDGGAGFIGMQSGVDTVGSVDVTRVAQIIADDFDRELDPNERWYVDVTLGVNANANVKGKRLEKKPRSSYFSAMLVKKNMKTKREVFGGFEVNDTNFDVLPAIEGTPNTDKSSGTALFLKGGIRFK